VHLFWRVFPPGGVMVDRWIIMRDLVNLIRQAQRDGRADLVLEGDVPELPEEIGNLTNLQRLEIRRSSIPRVPEQLWQLTNLRHLSINSNRLTKLPPGIGCLTHLRTLWLGGCRLTELPDELIELRDLVNLQISANRFSEFPPQVFELPSLQALYLDYNQIRHLPSDISRLDKLVTLDLSSNRLTTLPHELARLSALKEFSVVNNPLEGPLSKLIERGNEAILSYLKGLQEDGIPLYEAKVLLTGEGEVGKTSLVRALRDLPFKEGIPTTHGIELDKMTMRHPEADANISLNLWDFGGQEVYRITHQFFFSQRALYLLVWKPRQGQQENAVEQWLKLIRLRAGPDVKVIIVATHSDERRAELDVLHLQQTFGPMVVGQWLIDNKSGRGIFELKQAIAEHVADLPQMGMLMSKRWISVRERLQATHQPQIKFRSYARICAQHRLDEAAVTTLAQLLHDLGYIVHYGDDEGLRDVLVLKPEWLTKAIGYVLEDEETRAQGGELEHRRLVDIWQAPGKESYPREYHPYFLRLMEKFDVSYRISDSDRSLVGQLVPYKRPLQADLISSKALREQSLVCKLSDEAPGLIAWLIVRTYRFSTGNHWRRGTLLEHGAYASFALFELTAPCELRLRVSAPSPIYMFSILRDTVEDLIRRRWPGLKYELFAPCPTKLQDNSPCPGLFKLTALEDLLNLGRTQLLCYECYKDVSITLLLTGLAIPLVPLSERLKIWERQLDRIEDNLRVVDARTENIESLAAEAAFDIRVVLKALSVEVKDCPRLFTLEAMKDGGWDARRLWRNRYRLYMWCEHPGQEHRCDHPGYIFSESREWLERAAPYINALSKIMRILPVAGAVAGVLAVDPKQVHEVELKRIRAEIELMHNIAGVIGVPSYVPGRATSNVAITEGQGLRAFRELIFKLDATKSFAGLRRVLNESGQYLWVCPIHYDIYDPGLPELPNLPTSDN
jgi:internalin A